MTEEQTTLLIRSKKRQHLKLYLKEWLPDWLPVYTAIQASKVSWSFEYFECAETVEEKGMLLDFLKEEPLISLDIPDIAIKLGKRYVHTEMAELFPSKLALRYMPAGTGGIAWEQNAAIALPHAAASLGININTEILFFYQSFPPVMRIPLNAITELQEHEIMLPQNLCIMAPDYSWLIFRSMEYEWVWGKQK